MSQNDGREAQVSAWAERARRQAFSRRAPQRPSPPSGLHRWLDEPWQDLARNLPVLGLLKTAAAQREAWEADWSWRVGEDGEDGEDVLANALTGLTYTRRVTRRRGHYGPVLNRLRRQGCARRGAGGVRAARERVPGGRGSPCPGSSAARLGPGPHWAAVVSIAARVSSTRPSSGSAGPGSSVTAARDAATCAPGSPGAPPRPARRGVPRGRRRRLPRAAPAGQPGRRRPPTGRRPVARPDPPRRARTARPTRPDHARHTMPCHGGRAGGAAGGCGSCASPTATTLGGWCCHDIGETNLR